MLYSPGCIPIASSVPGTTSENSIPSPSDVNTNICVSGLISTTSAVNPPSTPDCELITSAKASTAVSVSAGPAFSATSLGGCLQSITLLDEQITLPPNPGPSNLCAGSVSSIYFNGIPFSCSAGNCSYTPLSSTLSLVILPEVLISVTWN